MLSMTDTTSGVLNDEFVVGLRGSSSPIVVTSSSARVRFIYFAVTSVGESLNIILQRLV